MDPELFTNGHSSGEAPWQCHPGTPSRLKRRLEHVRSASTGLDDDGSRAAARGIRAERARGPQERLGMADVRGPVQERPDPDPAERDDRVRFPRPHARSRGHHDHRAVRRRARLHSGTPRRPGARGLARDGRAYRTRGARWRGSGRSPPASWCPATCRSIRTGDRVPADARVLQSINLTVDEAALTGESAAVEKTIAAFDDAALPVGDRRNMIYAGHDRRLRARPGRGRRHRHVDRVRQIARMVESVDAGRTPLQENLDRLGATLGKAALVVVAIVVAVGLCARIAAHRHVHVRHRTGRGGRARSAARGRHDLARDRRAAHGQAARAGPPAADRRDAGQHVGDLLRQDRDADEERNDGPPAVRGSGAASSSRARVMTRPAI